MNNKSETEVDCLRDAGWPVGRWRPLLLARLACIASLVGVSALCQAQSAFDQYTHRTRTASSIQKLGPDLFGDSTNLLDGSTAFSATDVSLPTNGNVPLSLGRVFRVDGQTADQQGRTIYAQNAVFGPYWDIDVPYMVGTFDAMRGWVGASQNGSTAPNPNRCSQGGNGPPGTFGVGLFNLTFYQTNAFFGGIYINIPGNGMQEELLFPGNVVSQNIGGNSYHYKTKNNWLVGCLGAIKNGGGEGFAARLPDGRTYNFNWMVQRVYPSIIDDSCNASADIFPTSDAVRASNNGTKCFSGQAVPRNQVFLYATSATDRFGNTVTYTYDPNNPEHLSQISSSDGGLITLSYGSNGHVSTIAAGSRQWSYGYTATGTLNSVRLPDGSQSTIDTGQNTVEVTHYRSKTVWATCHINVGTETTDVAAGPGDTNTVTLTHPSGAVGTFVFRKILHGTREAERTCVQIPVAPGESNFYVSVSVPSDYQTASLVQKTLTIPGASTLQWTYQYHPGWAPPLQAVTGVTDAVRAVRTYTYGTDRQLNYGQLLQDTLTDASGLLRTATYQYLGSASGQNFTDAAGLQLGQNEGWEGGFHNLNRPLYSTVIAQQGTSFSMTVNTGCSSASVYCFDSFVRPTSVTRASR